ncbi:tumor necrosis factor receptor superfamily member 4 isoform X1 [Lepus europaeus]|uniref:tumor necrosis factor receptor superfamily member 4 isoform X1 n=1 Tax=Lepus europaeus TaxID=9983 RepID=UPI002B4774BB|nr:tumor necrosis factor receptor superfamily member 4 isoform X1 [Lepus europaeus]
MPVGAWPAALGLALLLLGLLLGAEARPDCVGDTYPGGHRCCHECQPGYGMVSRCDHSQDTICRPCEPGFYNEAVNYEACKPCTQCNRRSGSEPQQECTRTRDTVCRCRPGTQPLNGYKHGVDCAPCPQGHFSEGNNRACRPWTNCTLAGKRTLQPASSVSDTVCEDRSSLATRPWETPSAPARPPTARTSTARPRTPQGPSTPTLEASKGPQLAIVLSLGLGLGLLAPLAALLALYLHQRAWRPPKPPGECPLWIQPRPSLGAEAPPTSGSFPLPGGGSFRTPIQEEQTDAGSTMAKI